MVNLIQDFVEDLNYKNILLNLQHVNKARLKSKLKEDMLNKLYRLDDTNYLWVENCDYQGEEIVDESDVKEMIEEGFVEYNLYFAIGLGYFIIVL